MKIVAEWGPGVESANLIDSHIHLDAEAYREDWLQVLATSSARGVCAAVVPATNLASSRRILTMADQDSRVWPAVGIHPHDAARYQGQASLAELRTCLPRAVALGETGLEAHYDFCPLDQQLESFRGHLELAVESELPLILHCRQAEELLYQELSRRSLPGGGVVHCFTGSWDWAERFLDLGFYLGVTGMVTFPKSTNIHEIARRCPADRLLLETDGPYLAPIPHRGRRNEPSAIPEVARSVAALRGESPQQVAEAATAATCALFRRTLPKAGI